MIFRNRVPCRLSASSIVAASLILLVAAPIWTRAIPPEDKAIPKDRSTSTYVNSMIELRIGALGERMEEAFGRDFRTRLEQHLAEVGNLCTSFVPDPLARTNLLADSMERTLDLIIPKYRPGSDWERNIIAMRQARLEIAEKLAQQKIISESQLADLQEAVDQMPDELAVNATKKFFWVNFYPKLNLPPVADVEASNEPVIDEVALDQRIKAELRDDPKLEAIQTQIENKEKELARTRIRTPTRTANEIRKRLSWEFNELRHRYDELRSEKQEQFQAKLRAEMTKDFERNSRIRAIESRIRQLQEQVKELRDEAGGGKR